MLEHAFGVFWGCTCNTNINIWMEGVFDFIIIFGSSFSLGIIVFIDFIIVEVDLLKFLQAGECITTLQVTRTCSLRWRVCTIGDVGKGPDTRNG